MKSLQLHVLIATLLVAGILTGCRSDVDVSNIDTHAEPGDGHCAADW